MRVLVTGGSGFLGSHVAERLLEGGHEVRCLVRRSSDTSFLRAMRGQGGREVELHEGAIDAPDTLPSAVSGVDAIVHCAGLVKARTIDDFLRTNRDAAVDLARAAADNAPKLRRFVHVSTAAVMGPSHPSRPHGIGDPPNPVTVYGRSKLAAEVGLQLLRDRVPLTILRPPAIYGPRDREILALFQMVRRGVAFGLGHSLQANVMLYAQDCADACIRAIDSDVPSGSAHFLDDGGVYSFEEMAQHVADGYGRRLRLHLRVPEPLVWGAAFASETFGRVSGKTMMFTRDKVNELLMTHFVCDSGPARRDLGWEPRTKLAEGARLTAEWYRRHGWD